MSESGSSRIARLQAVLRAESTRRLLVLVVLSMASALLVMEYVRVPVRPVEVGEVADRDIRASLSFSFVDDPETPLYADGAVLAGSLQTTLGGIDIPKGTQVYLNLGAANHDPDEFAEPETFDIRRPDARNNISFGKGNHYCLGVRFAKFEAKVVMEVLTEKLPSLRLAGGHGFETFPNISFRGPSRLDVAWDTDAIPV